MKRQSLLSQVEGIEPQCINLSPCHPVFLLLSIQLVLCLKTQFYQNLMLFSALFFLFLSQRSISVFMNKATAVPLAIPAFK